MDQGQINVKVRVSLRRLLGINNTITPSLEGFIEHCSYDQIYDIIFYKTFLFNSSAKLALLYFPKFPNLATS